MPNQEAIRGSSDILASRRGEVIDVWNASQKRYDNYFSQSNEILSKGPLGTKKIEKFFKKLKNHINISVSGCPIPVLGIKVKQEERNLAFLKKQAYH